MNRIILIGNGFDLAHDLKTSYQHFIDNFWQKNIDNFKKGYGFVENDFLNIQTDFECIGYKDLHTKDTKDRERHINNFSSSLKKELVEKIRKIISAKVSLHDWEKFEIRVEENVEKSYKNLNRDYRYSLYVVSRIQIEIKNKFLKIISENLSLQNWVDIEDEYYKLLREILNRKIPDAQKNYTNIKRLNNDFSRIKEELENYLKEETTKCIGGNAIEFVNTTISENINALFERNDFTKEGVGYIGSFGPDSTLFLNFNYSNTEKLYIDQRGRGEIIHIHGELKKAKNPIIFGYGDEIGKEYEEIENLNDNDFLENIKSIRYSDTNNYKRLLDYINSDKYQIFLFGHSCGLSDRTLLNTLFEHENCVSIKPFYHKKENGTDNYSDIVRNISRHFKDKTIMREKVVNKEYCKPLS